MAYVSHPQDGDLFRFDRLHLPSPLPSESLYSWCARFHRLSGNADPRTTSRWLFGHPTSGLRHDFPTRLDFFCSSTLGHLGTCADVIYERTQFGLFAPFLHPAVRDQIVEAMRIPGAQSIRKRLGINRSGLGSGMPWKICPYCFEDDQEKAPAGAWHLLQQYSSVWYCLKHQLPLSCCPEHSLEPAERDWHLPADYAANDWTSLTIDPKHHGILASLASWTSAVSAIRTESFDGRLLRYTYLLRAKSLSWISMDGSLRFHMLRDAFRCHYAGLASLPGLQFLDATGGINGGFLGQLLRDYPGARHPLKHLLLIAFLFESPSQFFDAYAITHDAAAADGIDGLRKQLSETQARLRKLVGTDGRSVNSACMELGIPLSQAIRHLKAAGVEYRRRPRLLTPELRVELDARLRAGEERQQIATALGIRKAFIKDYLADKQELRAAWEKASDGRRRSRYREHFLQILAEHPGVPIKQIRRISGNGFQWLHRNDRAWLESHLPEIWNERE